MRRIVLGLALLLAGCGQGDPDPSPVPVPAPGPRTNVDFTGRWIGPEGLFLQVDAAGEGRYRLTLKDTLDREGVYDAQAEGEAFSFARDGQRLTVRPGVGADTGFKWLDGKQDCLIVRLGQEGYCRA